MNVKAVVYPEFGGPEVLHVAEVRGRATARIRSG
jgi:hypothetical protein